MLRWPTVVLATGLAGALAGSSSGAEVLFTTSSLETYVGVPVQIHVVIKNAADHEPPRFPEVDGAKVRALHRDAPQQSVVERAGRRERLITYAYAVTPFRAGPLTIPPIHVVADGKSFSSAPIPIVAKASEAGDLLYVRLVGESESAYVGEPIDVTLEVWLKPYQAKNIWMDAEDLWRHAVDEQASTWGPFVANLEEGARDVTYPADTRPDPYGGNQQYFVYSLKRRIWPDRPGVFDAAEVNVVVNYPLRVRLNRVARAGCPHDIVESRPISAMVKDSGIVIQALPDAGRPDSFRGAVGTYTMIVAAAPTEVSVGDPITLTLTIRGTGRMDLLQAPLLAEQETLTADFRVPDHELAGAVSGVVKTFTEIIRARHDRVTQVPAVEFSYFEPQSERYVTLKSDSIPLQVKESGRLPVARVSDGADLPGGRTQLLQVESGLLANYGDIEALLRHESSSLGWGTWGAAASGPAVYVACLLFRRRRDRLAGDSGFRRRRSARKTAMAAIRGAMAENDASAATSRIGAALTGYIADRCNLPPASVTRNDAVRELRSRNVPDVLLEDIDELLAECEGAQYGAAGPAGGAETVDRARRCVEELEKQGFQDR